MCSYYEFIYSCRETPNSPYPEIKSDTTVKALKLIKKMKNEISSGFYSLKRIINLFINI